MGAHGLAGKVPGYFRPPLRLSTQRLGSIFKHISYEGDVTGRVRVTVQC
jgi:hypothetical protein